MINTFWKKITIFNFGVFVIVLRIFGPILKYINDQSANDSIFPKTAENGYPFTDQINYNIKDIKLISHSLIEKNKHKTQPNPSLTLPTFNFCSFAEQINICKDNKNCFEYLNKIKEGNYNYHNFNEYSNNYLNNENIIQLFLEQNQFYDEKLGQKIEIPFFYEVVNGYSSYLNIISKDNNLIKLITHNEIKLNNLFYFYSLYLLSYIKRSNITNDIMINKLMAYKEEEIMNQINMIDIFTKNELKKIWDNNIIEKIINCLPDFDRRYSLLLDINSIKTIQNILFGDKTNDDFDFVFEQLNKGINYIFMEDDKLRTNAEFFINYKSYFIGIYWIIATGFIYYTNKYFLKHKEYYGKKSRIGKNIYTNEQLKKYKKYQENLKKIMQKQNRSKYTAEELKMIENLTKKKDDYVISKN